MIAFNISWKFSFLSFFTMFYYEIEKRDSIIKYATLYIEYIVAYTIIDSPTCLSIVKHSKNDENYKFLAYIKVNNLHNKKLLKIWINY